MIVLSLMIELLVKRGINEGIVCIFVLNVIQELLMLKEMIHIIVWFVVIVVVILMRKTCENCNKKTRVIFDALVNKDICNDCKTPFPVKIVTRQLQVGDKVTRKEFGHDRNGWELLESIVLTIKKISNDGSCLWFEELEHDGRVFFEEDKILQFWEKKNFELMIEDE